MGEEDRSKRGKHFGAAIKSSLITNNSCGHFESRQVGVNNLPHAVTKVGSGVWNPLP